MPTLTVDHNFAGKTARDCFNAALKSLPQAGFKVCGQRDLAYLATGLRRDSHGEVTCDVMAWPGVNSRITLLLQTDSPECDLEADAQSLVKALGKNLYSFDN